MQWLWAGILVLLLGMATPAAATELVGYTVLPADTFASGPASGQFDGQGLRQPQPRFASQPVQGFSAVQRGPAGSFLVLADNGFGGKPNSPDFLLRIYRIKADPARRDSVTVEGFISLRDPERKVPFLIVNEANSERLLTGADFDPESLVVANDGTFWIGDEFGPYLLHFDAMGKLLDPPYAVPGFGLKAEPDQDFVRSPQNPQVLAGSPQPGMMSIANLRSSGGFEGMARDPAGSKLHCLLERTVSGDEAGLLRLYEFDLVARRFTRAALRYRLEDPANAIGDMAVIDDSNYLVIERDAAAGDAARFKKIYAINLARADAAGVVTKLELVDLLSIRDPKNLAGFGPVFRFPFVTIENVLALDPSTLLVINDNNYPGTGGRGKDIKDPNEMIWLRLNAPLSLDSRLR